MHRTLTPLAALAVLGFVGSSVAQDAAQTAAGAGNAANAETMTCADLNEMEEAEGVSFLRGYQHGMAAAGGTSAPGANTAATTAAGGTPTPGPGNATTTGNVQRSGQAAGSEGGAGAPAEGTPFDFKAILASCHDVPNMPLDEILSGAFGAVN